MTILTYLISFSALAGCLSAASLTDLASKADLIVVGSVNTRSETAQRVAFDIAVERVLSGDKSLRVIPVSHAWTRRGVLLSTTDIIAVPLHGLWFLTKSASGDWDLLPVGGQDGVLPNLFVAAVPTLPTAYQSSAGATLTDRLAREVAAGVDLAGGRPETLINLLHTVSGPVVQNILVNLIASSNVPVQTAGLAGMLERGSPDAVVQLERLWPGIEKDASRSQVLAAVRDSFRSSSSAQVEQLARMATANATASPEMRAAAIHALAAIHARETLPFLASLLVSSDAGERMKGVFGLSAFANGCPVQTPANVASMEYLQFKNASPYRNGDTIAAFAFRRGSAEEEARLLSFWSNWWNANRAALGG